jgi:iron complex outermembrane recepter protein
MLKKTFIRNSITVAIAAASVSTAIAEAQVTALEEVVVSAQRRQESMQDVPLSVTAIGGDMLKQARITNSADLVKVTPSLTLQDAGNSRESSFNIRGIGTQSVSSGVEPSVSTVVDGVVMGRAGMAFAQLMDVNRVEVMRGPQGTLFGKNASAGVVHIITNDPMEAFEANVATSIEDDMYRVEGAVSIPLGDSAGLRIAAMTEDADGHVDNIYDGSELNGRENQAVRAKLRWDLSDSVELKFSADYSESESVCCQPTSRVSTDVANPTFGIQEDQLAPVTGSKDNLDANVGADVFSDSEMSGGSLEVNWALGDFMLTSITAVRSWENHANVDVDGTPTVWLDTNEGLTEQEQFTQELRLASPGDDRLNYVVGLYYFDQTLDRQFDRELFLSPPNPDTGNPGFSFAGAFDSTTDTTNYAAYGQVNYDLTTDLRLLAGMRYTNDELDFEFERTGTVIQGGVPIPPEPRFSDGTDDDDTSFKLGGQWDVDENNMVYLTWSEGYKSAAYSIVFEMSPGVEPVDAETSDAWELGLKSTLFDSRLILNTTLFYTEFENFQSQAQDTTTGQFALLNVGEVETAGLEVDFIAKPTSNWDIFGGIAWIDTEIKDFTNAPCSPALVADPSGECALTGSQDISGKGMPYSPDIRLTLSSRYLIPTDMSFDISLAGAYRWQDDVLFAIDQDENKIQDSYGVLDLSVGLVDQAGKYEVNLYVNNVLDENYASAILSNNIYSAGAVGALPYDQFIPRDAERRVGVEFRYFWQ